MVHNVGLYGAALFDPENGMRDSIFEWSEQSYTAFKKELSLYWTVKRKWKCV